MKKTIRALLGVASLTLASGISNGQYTTDWVGNTNPSLTGYVGNCARSMWVAPEGVVYTSSLWDEKGRNIGIYQNGVAIGSMAGTNGTQGSAICGDSSSVYAALQTNPGHVGRYNRSTKAQDLNFSVSAGTGDCIRGIAAFNGELYISDFSGNRIQVYSTAGVFKRGWSVTGPGAIAVEPGGANIWVAQQSTGKVTRFSSAGVQGTVIQMAATARPSALNINASAQLWIGDQGPDMNIKIYTNLTGTPILNSTYGVQGGYLSTVGGIKGQTGAKRFTRVVGIGSDSSGNVYVLNNPWGGTWDLGRNGKTDLHCYSSTGSLTWTAQALNFEGCAAADPGTDGADLYSADIVYNGSGGACFKANSIDPFTYPADARINVNDPARGEHFAHMASVGGKRILVACAGDKFFTYYFNTANGYIAIPGDSFGTSGVVIRNGFNLDSTGSVWTGLDRTNAIQYYGLTGFDANNKPIWAAAVSTPTPASIAPLTRIEYLPITDTMILTGGTTDWTMVGNRVEVYNGWKAGNRIVNRVINLTRAPAKSISAAGSYLFVGYYSVPNVDVFNLSTGALALTLVSNDSNIFVGNDTDSIPGIKAYLKTNGDYMVMKDDYNCNKVVIYRWNPNPNPFTSLNIGTVLSGTTTISGGTYTVTGAGVDIWGTSDNFQYCYRSMTGDGTVIARVNSMTFSSGTANISAKAGIMLRESTAIGSKHVDLVMTPSTNGLWMQYRAATDGTSASAGQVASARLPQWVKLVRAGSSFTGYYSSNGTTWTQIGSPATVSMNQTIKVGLAVTSHDNHQTCTSVMDNFSSP